MLISPSIIFQNSFNIHHRIRLSIVVIHVVVFMSLRHCEVSNCPVCFSSQQKGRYLFEMLISPWIILQNASKIHHRLRLLIVVISVVYFWERDVSYCVGDGRMVGSSTWSWVVDGEIFWCPHLFYLCQGFAKHKCLCWCIYMRGKYFSTKDVGFQRRQGFRCRQPYVNAYVCMYI
jgi:hypothetical protein